MKLPLLPVTTVGSWPRSEALLKEQRALRAGRSSRERFQALAAAEVAEFVALQEAVGVDVLTDGEQRRDNFYSFVADKLDGVQLMTLGDMLDLVEDKAGFERLLQTLDVPAFGISNPTCVGKVSVREPIALDEARFLRAATDRPIKVPLPGPYLLTRAMWVPEAAGRYYASKEELGEEVVAILADEVRRLVAEGVDFVQFDEPVLTELVFSQGETRTFMCAALAARSDPKEELDFAVGLINQVAEAGKGCRTGLHVCRGNWSQREETLLAGPYHPLVPVFDRLAVDQLVLEYATPRAGPLIPMGGKELGLGAVNPRTAKVETPDEIAARIHEALAHVPADRLWLNPDCGFGTFSLRPMNDRDTARRKLESLVAAAQAVRAELAGAADRREGA